MEQASGDIIDDEAVKSDVSFAITRLLLLLGRLKTGYNARYLPVTVNSLQNLLRILEEKEVKSLEINNYISEIILRKEKFCKVFRIPDTLRDNPTISGFRSTISEICDTYITDFCKEERRFIGTQSDYTLRLFLAQRAKKYCELLEQYAGSENQIVLGLFHTWCDFQLSESGCPTEAGSNF